MKSVVATDSSNQYYRRKHDDLLSSEKNIFWSKNVIFLTFFQKTENRPLLAHQKGHNF
jgi:hypothetical protein